MSDTSAPVIVRMADLADRTGINRGTLSAWVTRGKLEAGALEAGVYDWRRLRPILVDLVSNDGHRHGRPAPAHRPVAEWPA